MRLELYHEGYRNQWNNLITTSLNGTFLHTRNFYDHNPNNALDDHSFVFFKGDRLAAVLPCNLYTSSEGSLILHSYLRATYGGFVIQDEIGVQEAVEMVALLKEYARQMGIKEIVIRNPFKIFNSKLCEETDYAMWYHGFQIKTRELETAIALGDYGTVSTAYYDSTKRSIKKSRANVTVVESDNFVDFWKLLERNLKEKHNIKPTHDYQQFVHLIENVGARNIKLFIATRENQVIAGIVVFVANRNTLHAQYIASDTEHQQFRPLNAVIDEIIKWGCSSGFRFLNLGTSNFNGGKGINDGLFRFKEGFGGRSVLRETMHLVL